MAIVFYPYDIKYHDVDDKVVIDILAIQSNREIIIRITDTECHFILELPSFINIYISENKELFQTQLLNKLGDYAPNKVVFQYGYKKYNYRQQTMPTLFMLCYFTNLHRMNKCRKRLQKPMNYEDFGVLSFNVFNNKDAILKKIEASFYLSRWMCTSTSKEEQPKITIYTTNSIDNLKMCSQHEGELTKGAKH